MAAVFLFAISRNANKSRKVPQLTGKFQTRFMTMVKAIIAPNRWWNNKGLKK